MRRFMLAAAGSMLILAACTDQQAPTEPSAPEPDALISSCTVTRFPLVQASALIVKVFPNGRLRIEALARAGTIALLWNTCQASAAQRAAVDFVNWMNSNSRRLTGTQAQRNQLINLILSGVGIPGTVPEGAPGDFGVGFFDPSSTTNTLVKTVSGTALVELPPGSFLEPTTIVISRLSDNFELSNFDGNQFPPYFDYNAINASGIHDLEGSRTAVVGFCLFPLPDPGEPPEGDEVSYPPESSRRIGHNPVEGATNFPFEILDPVDLEAEGLAEELNCPTSLPPYTPDPGPIGFGGGFSGFANAAWHQAGASLGSIARAIFLPQPLEATMLGTLPPPIGGRAPSLSPFGVVEVGGTEIGLVDGDLSGDEFFVGETLDGCSGDSCFPEFQVLDGETPVTTPTSLTVTLIPAEGSTGTLSGTTTKSTSATSPFTAEFNDLTISAPGTYQLLVTAPGVASYTTGSFTVAENPALTLLSVSSFGEDISKRGSLYTINSRTGAVTWIGRLSTNPDQYTIATNMAIRQSDQTIFVWSNSDGVLLTVDRTTGLGTPVAETAPPAGTAIQALAFSPTGTLYGIEDGAVEGSLSNLVSIDPSTGGRTLIGALGSGLRVSGAEFDCSGTLYGIEFSGVSSRLVTINVSTGAATVVATLSPNVTNIQSIVFMPSGTLTGTAGNLFDINPVTGAVSNIRPVSPTDATPQGLGSSRTCEIIG